MFSKRKMKKRWIGIVCLVLVLGNLCASVCAADLSSGESVALHRSEGGRDIRALTVEKIPEGLKRTLDGGNEEVIIKGVEPLHADAMDVLTARNSDGTLSRLLFEEPIKFVDEETNEIRFIDNTIQKPDSLLNRFFSDVAYENADNDIKVFMPKKIENGVRLEKDGYAFRVTPVSSKNASAVKKEVPLLGETTEVVEYDGVFGENTEVRYQPISKGVENHIVLKEFSGTNTFSFLVDSSGLIPDVSEGEIVRFLDKQTREPVYIFGKAWAMNSCAVADEGGNVASKSGNVVYQVESAGEDQYLLTVIVEEDFLVASTTQYPVLVQYTEVYGYSQGNISYTSVFSSRSVTWPDYAYEYIQVGCRSSSNSEDGVVYGESIGYIQLEGLDFFTDDIYPEKISDVSVVLKQTYGSQSSYVIGMYDSTTSVLSDSATYSVISNNIGSLQSTVICGGNGNYSWSIKNIFACWLDYELHGDGWNRYQMMIKAISNGKNYKQFYCSNSNLYLKITYEDIEYGNGGSYRQVNGDEPNCLGYALCMDTSVEPRRSIFDNTHLTQNFRDGFQSTIMQETRYVESCRPIDSYVDDIFEDEYRLAVRAPNCYGDNLVYHAIYQLSDGTWAGKNHIDDSKHFGKSNPCTTPEMWEGDAYYPGSGTIYFAIKLRR